MTIEFIIKEIREQKKMTLEDLERETGINRKRLSDIENNKITDKVLLVEALLIAETLGVDIKDLFVTGSIEIK